jgi:NAD(P)-dependent dehydrogenase (short-subunit alcohol dehydrogenase family)
MTQFLKAGTVLFLTGSTGIAADTARLAARDGASVFVISRTDQHCKELTGEIIEAGGSCDYAATELTKSDEVESAVRKCVDRFGKIDSLFNVAGISGRKFGDGPIHECTEEGWDLTLDTNVKSMFLVCREVLKQMMRQEVDVDGIRGTILNMASVLAFSPEPNYFATHAYAASKGAIIALSKSMASYYAEHRIRVNVIAPALVRTPMSMRAQTNPAILEKMKTKQPLCSELIDSEDVARAALFLLVNSSAMITGDVLNLDAGWCVSG